jgi:fructokinase
MGSDDEVLRDLIKTNELRVIALTRGADGATLISASGERSDQPVAPTKIIDTVGAGDAYTAALALGLLRGESLENINSCGNRVAAYVCSQPGGTPHFPEQFCRKSEFR